MTNPQNNKLDKEFLLTIFHDMGENIECTKKRSFNLLLAYSAICAFLINEKISVATHKCVKWPLLIGFLLFLFILWDNYKRMKQRRVVIQEIHKELEKHEELKLPDKVNDEIKVLTKRGKKWFGEFILFMQALYLLTVYLLLFVPNLIPDCK